MVIREFKNHYTDYTITVKMNPTYKEIIVLGLLQKFDVPQFFFREFKKAELNHYSVNEFFHGLLDIIKAFEEQIESQMVTERLRIHEKLIEAQTSINSDSKEANSLIDALLGRLSEIKKELEWIRMPDPRITTKVRYIHIQELKFSIEQAFLRVLEETNSDTKKNAKPNKNNIEVEFKDFFNSNITHNAIVEIQSTYSKAGAQKIAILIDLLLNDLKCINIIPRSATKGRKKFYQKLIGNDQKRDTELNKYFESNSGALKILNDPNITKIKQHLETLIK